ncbi:Proteasome subunit beta type-3-B, partial [Cucurbita argyrosperma subsp. sororia]
MSMIVGKARVADLIPIFEYNGSAVVAMIFLGLSSLGTDAQTLYQRLVYQHKLHQLREERDMKPETFASLVSARLYEKRLDID